MLCAACEAIFRDVYLLGSNKRIPWAHDLDSFHRARLSGCQICNFLWAHLPKQLAVTELSLDHFPCHYAFQLLSADWARYGRGPEFLEIEVGGDETEEFAEERAGKAQSRHGSDFNIHKLRYLLKNEVRPLLSGEIEIWAVLCFDVGAHQIRFPMQVHRDEAADELALVRLSEQDTTGSVETLQLGKHWLSECISNHPECTPVYEDSAWHPFRLIDVGTTDCPSLKLTLGSTLPPKTQYATLSHCWGDTQDSIVTRETLTAFFDAIPPHVLSCTARDAVHVARALGLRYLWIDGFCIIQGDKNDWKTQSAQMAKVYGWSTCTIAAASSRSGSESFLRTRNQHAVRPCEVPNPFGTEANMSFQIGAQSLSTVFDEEVKATSWHNRGWVFQERLLSQRLLIFGATQMMWSCQRHSAAESWPGGRTSKHHVDRFESFEAEKLELHQLLNPKRRLDTKDEVWESVVQRYTKAEMRKSSDRLVALQGIASRIMDATGRHYAFGLWLDGTLAESLLWHVSTDMIGTAQRLQNMPSWSWGSVAVPVEFLEDQTFLTRTYVEMIGSQYLALERSNSEPGLEIRGPLFEMTLILHPLKQYFELRRDDYVEFKRRQSVYQDNLSTSSQRPISMEDETRRKVRRFTAVGIELRATIRCIYVGVTSALHSLSRISRRIWRKKLYPHVEPYVTSTRPLRRKLFGKYVQPPLVWLKDAVWHLLQSSGNAMNWVWASLCSYQVLCCLELIGLLGSELLRRCLRGFLWLSDLLFQILWLPFKLWGAKLHGDPDWDWILLWNLTVPFPYLFPSVFGPLRARPLTDYERENLPRPVLRLDYGRLEGPTYEDWMARAIPDNQGPCLNAECWVDVPLDMEADLTVTCLLVLRRHQIHGLLLQHQGQTENKYRRVGMFKASKSESCFTWTEEAIQSITLI